MIRAIGKRSGKKVTVECAKQNGEWRFMFDGKRDYSLEVEIEDLRMNPRPIMATYWPECDALKIAAVLPYFFDRGGVEQIEVDDPEAKKELGTVESEEGVVY